MQNLTTEQKKIIKQLAMEITNDIFKIYFVVFLVFVVFELWRPGFVVNYLNMNALLFIVLVSGIVSLFFNDNKYD